MNPSSLKSIAKKNGVDLDVNADDDTDVNVDTTRTSSSTSTSTSTNLSKMSRSRLMNSIIEMMCHDIIFMPSLSTIEDSTTEATQIVSTTMHTNSNTDNNTDNNTDTGTTKSTSTSATEQTKAFEMKKWKRRIYKIENEFEILWKQVIGAKGHGTSSGSGSHGRLYCYHSIIQFLKYMYSYFDFYNSEEGQGSCDDTDNGDDESQKYNWSELSRRLTELQSIIMNPNSRQIEIVPVDQFEEEEVTSSNATATTIGPTVSAKEKRDHESKLKMHEKEFEQIQLKLSIQYCLTFLNMKGEGNDEISPMNGVRSDYSSKAVEAF